MLLTSLDAGREEGMDKHKASDDSAQLFAAVLKNYERTPAISNYATASSAANCSTASSAMHPKTTAGPPPM